MILTNLKLWFYRFFHRSNQIIAQILIKIILEIRPLFGPLGVCPFKLGCTDFAIFQLEQNLLPNALCQILMRLIRCNPVWIYFFRKRTNAI
jgi:putative component of membrane protein insertase Oxa1/YidC/SpoIIIJ protein YidD